MVRLSNAGLGATVGVADSGVGERQHDSTPPGGLRESACKFALPAPTLPRVECWHEWHRSHAPFLENLMSDEQMKHFDRAGNHFRDAILVMQDVVLGMMGVTGTLFVVFNSFELSAHPPEPRTMVAAGTVLHFGDSPPSGAPAAPQPPH